MDSMRDLAGQQRGFKQAFESAQRSTKIFFGAILALWIIFLLAYFWIFGTDLPANQPFIPGIVFVLSFIAVMVILASRAGKRTENEVRDWIRTHPGSALYEGMFAVKPAKGQDKGKSTNPSGKLILTEKEAIFFIAPLLGTKSVIWKTPKSDIEIIQDENYKHALHGDVIKAEQAILLARIQGKEVKLTVSHPSRFLNEL